MTTVPASLTSRVAALVPQVLSVYAETAEPATADALDEAVERLADALLAWSDDLVDGGCGVGGAGSGPDLTVPARASSQLSRALRAGRIPGDPISSQVGGGQLRAAERGVREIVRQVRAEQARSTGMTLAAALSLLAEALLDLAAVTQAEQARLRRGPEDVDQVIGRVAAAERRLQQVAAATLRP